MNLRRYLALLLIAAFPMACSSSSPTRVAAGDDGNGTPTGDVPALYTQFEADAVYLNGSNVTIETDDVPNHPSPYFGVGDSRYVEPWDGMFVNPNRIIAQEMTFHIPANPMIAAAPSATDLGPIGVAVNGVVMFNQYAGRTPTGWLPLDNEIQSFDQYSGHPQQTGQYHYHVDPVYLTGDDPSALVGVLRDGFPVYGTQDMDGSTPSDLDACNGHEGVTRDYQEGIYHYHITDDVPYISGCYKGTPGAWTN